MGEVHDLYISEIYGHGAVKKTTFSCQHNYGLQYSDGNPPHGGVNAGQVRENRDSGQISGYRIDDCCSARSTIDSRRCSSV